MKKILNLQVCFALFLAAAPLAATAQTTFFSDNFTTGSTLNQSPTTNLTGTATAYQTYIGLTGGNTTSTIAPNDLNLTLPNSGAVLGELVGLFTNSAVALTTNGDYIDIRVVFVNSNILCGLDAGTASLHIGLFNSGGVPPNQGNITTGTGSASGGTMTWQGYFSRLYENGPSGIYTRPSQSANGLTSQNQDLLFTGASTSQAFNNPKSATIGSTVATVVSCSPGLTYTLQLVISYNGAGSVSISNALYSGSGVSGTPINVITNQIATNATFLTSAFDGFAIGWRNATTAQLSMADIASIQVIGQSTGNTNPPTITSQPVSVTVATNGSTAFFVSATGTGTIGYQWYRNSTPLTNTGNISGANSSMLVVSPAGVGDVFSTNNGYYVSCSSKSGSFTNSVTNSLALMPATNLVWNPSANNSWDVNSNANWQDPYSNQTVFNYGDSVTFNDFYGGGQVALTGPYLSAASVTVTGTSSTPYTFAAASTGSFAGPGSLIYNGSVRLNINNANTYSGGTIISNAGAYLYLGNLSGLGTGPLTLAGGTMEIVPAGSGSSWISANVVVADNFTIQFDGTGSYAGYFNGNFSGTTNKTLTFVVPAGNTTTNERIRISGASTTYNANLALNSSLLTLAPYNATSNQTYNGIISGAGALIQRGSGTTILNGANTYSGGTTPSTGAIGFGTGAAIGTGPLYLAPEVPNLTGSGEVFASGGPITITNSIQYPSATNNLTLIVGGANNLTFSGPFTLNGNDGLGTNNIRTIQITNTGLTTISGVISDGGLGYGLIETGNGTNATGPLALSNTETYTGPTTVSGGTLQVNGSLNAASAVTVSSNATLAGTGIINGTVTVNASGTLAPGTASAIGTLTLNGGLTLNGNLLFKVKKLVSPSNDVASVSGALTNGGTGKLTVMNLGPALAVGDKFKLFNKPLTNGAALTVTGAGAVWVNNLQVDGSISVSSTNLPQPVITTTTILNGTSLVFSGTNGTLGATYYVLTSTNLVLPLSSWTPIFTNTFITGGAFSVTNAISPSVPQRFYILILP